MIFRWSILGVISFLLLAFGYQADRLYQESYKEEQRKSVLNQLSIVRAKLEGNIQANIQTVQGMVGLIANEPRLSQARFSQYAAPLISGRTQLRNIAGAPDLIIQLMYPLEGNKGAIGLDFTKNKAQREAAIKARETRKMVFDGPVNLVQGGQGFIARIPVFEPTEESSEGRFWGLISAVIDVESLYRESGLLADDLAINLAIARVETEDRDLKVFYGFEDLLRGEPIIMEIVLPNATWRLAAEPKSGWLQTAPNAMLYRLLILTIIVTVISLLFIVLRSGMVTEAHEKRLRALFELSPMGIALNDFKTGRFIELNDALVAPTGYTKSEFVNLSYWDLTPKEYAEDEAKQLQDLSSRGRYGPYEKEYIRKDGSRYPVLLNGVLTTDSQGQQFIWSIVEDISAQKEANRVLIEAKDKAESAARAKSEFLATMSHEIRTPMNGVLGMLTLLEKTPLDDTQKHKLRVAKTSGETLLNLINDILDFSKVEAGKIDLEWIDFELNGELEKIIDTFAVAAREKGIELVFSVEGIAESRVKGDPARLRQILTNLISNAIKFTRQGQVAVNCRLEKDNQSYRFFGSVEDTGIGIADDNLEAIFDAFTQADTSTTRQFGGTGLGLAICKKLCRAMGGDISATSSLGDGSRFDFDISLKPASSNRVIGEDQVTVPKLDLNFAAEQRVLLVEDIAFNQEVARYMLEEFGVTPDIVDSGQGAIDALKSNTQAYGLVFMDCQMPGMDGYETTRRIRRGEAGSQNKNITIVAMTANAMKGDKEKCMDAGMNDYLSKPIDGDQVYGMLKKWFAAA